MKEQKTALGLKVFLQMLSVLYSWPSLVQKMRINLRGECL